MSQKDDEVGKRIETCKTCDQLTKLKLCKVCGCFMPAKVRLKGSSCPLGKWIAIIPAK